MDLKQYTKSLYSGKYSNRITLKNLTKSESIDHPIDSKVLVREYKDGVINKWIYLNDNEFTKNFSHPKLTEKMLIWDDEHKRLLNQFDDVTLTLNNHVYKYFFASSFYEIRGANSLNWSYSVERRGRFAEEVKKMIKNVQVDPNQFGYFGFVTEDDYKNALVLLKMLSYNIRLSTKSIYKIS